MHAPCFPELSTFTRGYMIKRTRRVVLFACLVTTVSLASNDPFVGDWKLNVSKSTLTDRMTVERVGDDTYTFDFGGGPERIVVDGTDQTSQLYGGGTLSVGVQGDGWNVVRKTNGRTLISASWSLSKDGARLTDHFRSFNPDGSPYTLNYVYERRAGGSGFAGTWVSTSPEAANYIVELRIRPYGNDGLSLVDSASQLTGNMNFAASSIRRLDEHTLALIRAKSGGELTEFLQLKLSPDLKTLTMTPHAVAGAEPHILVFDRQ
jgi:hypothetical protein